MSLLTNENQSAKPLVFIVGVTSVGKTNLGFELAYKNQGGVVNSDSLQIYKGLDIGTAKPNFKLHPKIPYFLFDIVEAPQVFTAGDFRREALFVLEKELPSQPLFMVGGSGFYIQALEKGMYPLKTISEEVKLQIQKDESLKGLSYLYEELKQKDPETAKNISPNDKYRIVRALSIIRNKQKPLSQIQKDFSPTPLPWKYKKIGLDIPKEELLKKVKTRTKGMIDGGLLDEIQLFLSKGHENWRPFSSLGYKEGREFLKGKLNKEELFEEIVKNTMAYAKRQKTWFKKDSSIKWYSHLESVSKINQELNLF